MKRLKTALVYVLILSMLMGMFPAAATGEMSDLSHCTVKPQKTS